MSTSPPFRVLVFSKTSGYRHTSIPAGITMINNLAAQSRLFTVDASEDAAVFSSKSFAQYSAVVLLQCIGDIFDSKQLKAFKEFVRSGGGVVAIHGAAAGMPEDEWYGKLIGAHFDMHPPAEFGNVVVELQNKGHMIMGGQGGRKDWMDEWYNFRTHPRDNNNLKILLKGDTKSFKGGKMGEDHPLEWFQEFEGGRSFFTALGHFDEAYVDDWFMKRVLRGIIWTTKLEESMDERH